MLLTFSIIIAIVLGLGAAWVLSSPRQQPDRAAEACWRALSENLDYDYDPGGLLQGPALSGSVESLSISADTFFQAREGRKQLFTRFVITGEGLPESLEGIRKARGGDPPAKKLLAQITRRYARELIKHIGATVANGKLKWLREGVVWNPQNVAKTVRRLVEIAQFLSFDRNDEAGRLLTAYNDESLPDALRHDIQRLLFSEFSGTEACETVAAETLEGRDVNLQIGAAKALGERGLPTLADIARTASNGPETRENAVLAICSHPDPAEALPHLAKVLRDTSTETVRIALGVVRKQRFIASLRLVGELAVDPSSSTENVALMVECLAEIGNSSVESALLTLLQHSHVTIRRRAARGLGQVGTPNSFEHLAKIAERSGENRKVRDIAVDSVRKIRARHGLEDTKAQAG